MSTDKDEAQRLADALDAYGETTQAESNLRAKVSALLRRWPDAGEPVMCPGRPDSRCNYDAHCGRVCNKCGRIHDGHANPNGTITSRGHTAPPAESERIVSLERLNRIAALEAALREVLAYCEEAGHDWMCMVEARAALRAIEEVRRG